jgi:hypothetical protein
MRTSQFVAVSGTRENIHPSLDALSEASRMYLSVRMMVSPPKSHQRLCMSESRYGCAGTVRMNPHRNPGRALSFIGLGGCTHRFETVCSQL